MKTRILVFLFLIAGFAFLTSCGEEKIESKNMEQIYKDEGVPVKVTEIKKGVFEKELMYNTVLSGIKESTASAMIGGRIEKVLVKVGDFVQKDQVIITFPTDNPSTQYFQSKVAYENSKNTYERYQKLFDVGGISAQDLDNVKTQYEVSKANWESVKKMVKILAPISGYVTQLSARETDNVKKETVLATIADLRKLKASVQITEDDISDVKVGAKASAVWQGNKIEGKVTQVDMAMNPVTQSFNADIVFDNSSKIMKAGVTADITIAGGESDESITVERKNLIKKSDDYYAYVLNGNKAVMKKVKIGKSSGIYSEVIDGLSEGDLLIVEGQMFLDNNTIVKVIK